MTTLRASALSAAVAAAMGLVACRGGGYGTADTPSPATSGYKASGSDTSGVTGAARTIQLESAHNSGMTGTAVLRPMGSRTSVMLMLVPPAGMDAAAGQQYAAHIHTGTCAAPGAIVAPLTTATFQNGHLMSMTVVNIPAATLMDGQHVIAAHATGSESSQSVACASLTGM